MRSSVVILLTGYPPTLRAHLRRAFGADGAKRLTSAGVIRGKTNTATGSLHPDWEINNEVMMENVGAANRDPENEAPVITGTGPQTITLPNTVELSAAAREGDHFRFAHQITFSAN